MFRRAVIALACCACSENSVPLDTHEVRVTALAGGKADVGAPVVAHRANGEVLDSEETNELGQAIVTVETNAYITTWFRWTPRLGSEGAEQPEMRTFAVTALAPQAELLIHGPVPQLPTIGVLEVNVAEPVVASRYLIGIGCAVKVVTSLPATIELTERCLGTDATVDILVRALGDQYEYLGHYVAGQAVFDGAIAPFNPTSWQQSAAPIRLVLDGVDPVVRLALVADGLEIDDDVVNAAGVQKNGSLWAGLAATNILVRGFLFSDGTLGGQRGMFVRSLNGLADEIRVSSDDFPQWTGGSAEVSVAGQPSMRWGDFLDDVDLVYHSTQLDTFSWNVVVPASPGSLTLPFALDTPPAYMLTAMTRRFDSPQLDGYEHAVAAGLHFERAAPSVDHVLAPGAGLIRSAAAF